MYIIPNGRDYMTFRCGRKELCNVMTATQDFLSDL